MNIKQKVKLTRKERIFLINIFKSNKTEFFISSDETILIETRDDFLMKEKAHDDVHKLFMGLFNKDIKGTTCCNYNGGITFILNCTTNNNKKFSNDIRYNKLNKDFLLEKLRKIIEEQDFENDIVPNMIIVKSCTEALMNLSLIINRA
jgi:hypothetical protein